MNRDFSDMLRALSDASAEFEAWADHLSVNIQGMSVPVLGRAALIKNKTTAGRPKDLADVAALTTDPGPFDDA